MLESQTEVVMRWPRVRSRGALMVFALAIMAYYVNAYSVHWQRCASTPDIFDLTQQVLQGTAQSPYQFQMYVSARVVSGIAVVMRPPVEAVLRRPISDANRSSSVSHRIGRILTEDVEQVFSLQSRSSQNAM
jgi:hypothetical protein